VCAHGGDANSHWRDREKAGTGSSRHFGKVGCLRREVTVAEDAPVFSMAERGEYVVETRELPPGMREGS